MMLFSRRPESSPSSEPTTEPASPPPPPAAWESRPAAPQAAAERTEAHQGPDGSRTQSFIDASLTIIGDIHAEGDVRLDGRVCGNVRCAQLIVGKDAAITGAVTAEQVIIRGRITGTIRAPVVIIQGTAYVESDVTYSVLAIDDGATFEGKVHRSANPLAEAVSTPPFEQLQEMARVAEEASGPAGPAAEPQGATSAPVANGHDRTTGHQPAPPHG